MEENLQIYGTIYRLFNLINGKYYVGQTTQNPYKYYKESYVYQDGGGRTKLNRAIKKYGIESFEFSVVEFAANKQELDNKEIYWITKCDSLNNGYNIKTGGANGRLSDESMAAGILKKIGKHCSPQTEFKKGMIPWNKGLTSEEYFIKTGKKYNLNTAPPTEEQKKKISISLKEKYKTGELQTWNKGVPMSKETKEKLSKALMGRTSPRKGIAVSGEQKRQISETLKQKYKSGELIHSCWGKKHSSETIEKMSKPRQKTENFGKKVICIETGKIYKSVTLAAKENNLLISSISDVCNGKQGHTGKLHWKFVK